MTESVWLAWVRSALRSRWLKWKPRSDALIAARRAYSGSNSRQKWEYQCNICSDWHNAKSVEVDHYPRNAGSILSADDIGEFCNNLFCETDNLRVVCSKCHSVYTLSQSKGISFEDAAIEKKAIAFCKQDKQIVLAFLAEYGYNGGSVSTAAKRRKLVEHIYKEK